MSVDYSAGVAYGWRLTDQQKDDINEKTDYKYEDDYIPINAYVISDWILGEWIYEIESGEAVPIDKFRDDSEFRQKIMDKFLPVFKEAGYENISEPEFWLVCSVT